MKTPDKNDIVNFLQNLQRQIASTFDSLEPNEKFNFKPWDYPMGSGGGIMGHIRGSIFEKAAIHFSAIHGNALPFNENSGPFFATGVSLITHMMNPHAPTVHMNVRYIETQNQFWFGGGYDLTPMGFFYEQDSQEFHNFAKKTLDQFSPSLYSEFSANAKKYFYIPHRNKERGVGGIFFDYFNSGNLTNDLAMWKAVGLSLTDAIMPIYKRRITMPFSAEDKALQNKLRAHYVEFNLLYDRGTKFGFQSNGNPEAILSSLPPSASW